MTRRGSLLSTVDEFGVPLDDVALGHQIVRGAIEQHERDGTLKRLKIMAEKWTGTKQRDDLKTCPFCNTAAVQQVRLADNDTNMQWRIGCGNPHCFVEPNTPPFAALKDAEWAWQERVSAGADEAHGGSHEIAPAQDK